MTKNRMSRRSFLSATSGMVAAGLTSRFASAKLKDQPNILWLVSEDNGPYIGAYGDKLAHTPVIDALARRGLLYRYAYASAPVCAVSRFGILTGVLAETCGPAHHMRARAQVADVLMGYPEYLRRAGYYCTNNGKTDYNCDIDPQDIWDESSDHGHWRNRPPGTPFMSVFNYVTTHEGAIFKPFAGRVKPQDVRVPAFLPDIAEIREGIASYYNRIEMLDGQLGQRLAELEADGLTDDTIVFYYSDHGGVLPRSKHYCYDEGLRSCLIIAVPPKYQHLAPVPMGSEIDSPVTLIDLAPTVLAIAGIDKPVHMAGKPLLGRNRATPGHYAFGMRNRMGERYDMVRTVSDGKYRYIRNYMPHRPWGQHHSYSWLHKSFQEWERLYRDGELSSIQARFFEPKPFEELYDLVEDPDQVENLVDRPGQKQRLRALRRVLDEHMLAINDNGFIPEGSPLEGYERSREPGAYPLQRAMKTAWAAAERKEDPSAYVTGLSDPNEVIRYWSAQGLLILARRAAPAHPALRQSMEEDESPHVRIVAAEALAGLGDPDQPLEILAAMLDHPVYPARLQAINALTFIGTPSKAVLPAIDRAARRDDVEDWTVRTAARYLSAVLHGDYDPSYPVFDSEWFREWRRRTGQI